MLNSEPWPISSLGGKRRGLIAPMRTDSDVRRRRCPLEPIADAGVADVDACVAAVVMPRFELAVAVVAILASECNIGSVVDDDDEGSCGASCC
jgi:hypothetical protein